MTETNWNYIDNLAKEAINGDQSSYKDFLSLISDYVRKKIWRAIPKNNQEDVVQEVLLAIHKSLKTLDTSKPCKPWINAICHYKVNDCLRFIYKNANISDDDQIENHHVEEFDQTEFKQFVEHASKPLSNNEAKILMMLKYEGHSVSEVSKNLGKSESNIKVISFRAIKKIREFLSKEEFYE
jgi:RNA polymerase sigma-70 factor (ECF subfamily)